MESTSEYKYRIKKEWKVNSKGNKTHKFFPQYKSPIFGWRYMHSYWSSSVKSSLYPEDNLPLMVVTVFMSLFAVVGLITFLAGAFLPGLIIMLIGLSVECITLKLVYLMMKYSI
jgi:hypothetical protein